MVGLHPSSSQLEPQPKTALKQVINVYNFRPKNKNKTKLLKYCVLRTILISVCFPFLSSVAILLKIFSHSDQRHRFVHLNFYHL